MADVYIGIDQSYSGFAIVALVGKSRVDSVSKYPSSKFGAGVDRLMAVKKDVEDVVFALNLASAETVHVCMEGYAAERKFGREQSGELGAIVKLALRRALPPPVCYPTIVPPTSLKKFVTGAGNAAKDNMLLGVYKKWGVEFKDNNLADAYGLARLAEAIHTNITSFKYEEDVIAKLTPHTEQWPMS